MSPTTAPTHDSYDFHAIERKWQARWRVHRTYETPRRPEGPTYFLLVFPPYPNGRIHMGHVRNYTIGDALARYKKMCGAAVLHPIGFDAFGLPNEMEAARQGRDPAEVTVRNIKAMRHQLKRLGYAYDWRRQIITINPRYYRWNQWLFLALFDRNLAYRKEGPVQWCPSCRTSLANEQVVDGRCWRCEQEVLIRRATQWFFRLRAYAEEIWAEAEAGAFPPNVGAMLKEWLRRAVGAELTFPVEGGRGVISTFTTKAELSYGARYLALSPEHPLADALVHGTPAEPKLRTLRDRVRACVDPGALVDGFDTGRTARHPLTGETIPIWVAAYVDPEFGTGAVMGNPCHDRNDYTFAQQYGLPGKLVAHPAGSSWDYATQGPYLDEGVLMDSGPFSDRSSMEARDLVISDWESRSIGKRCTMFGIRDWLVSRQRAWGTPIPAIHCPRCGAVGVDREELPVRLPKNLRDTGEGNPLAQRRDFLTCRCPRCAGPAQRETDTMDTFIDTTWYYLRSTNPRYRESLCDPRAVAGWGPADLYVGGIEIAVPIMLYGSFITKALRDAGCVDFALPCRALLAHDMVLKDGKKMSKSLGNTVDPEDLIEQVGADTVRFFILSLASPAKKIEWSAARLQGCHKFLKRVWNLGLRHAARRQSEAGLSSSKGSDTRGSDRQGINSLAESKESPLKRTPHTVGFQPTSHDSAGEFDSPAARWNVQPVHLSTVSSSAGSLQHASVDGGGLGSGPEQQLIRRTHEAIRAVTIDMDRLQPNTCLMTLIKFLYSLEEVESRIGERRAFHEAFCTLLQLLAPFTPHLCAELWERIGMVADLSAMRWPAYDPAILSAAATKNISVKINGELVARLEIPVDASEDQLIRLAYAHAAVQQRLGGSRANREVYVKDQMLNLVT